MKKKKKKNGSGGDSGGVDGFPDEMKQLYENQDRIIRLLTRQLGHLIRSKAERFSWNQTSFCPFF